MLVKIVIAVLFLIGVLTMLIIHKNKITLPTTIEIVLVSIFGFFASFAFFGLKFMPEDEYFSFPWEYVLIFLIIWINVTCISMFVWVMLPQVIQKIQDYNTSINKPCENFFLKSFLFILGVHLLYWIFWFPGHLSPDSVSIYHNTYSNSFPFSKGIYAPIGSLLVKILPSAASLIFFQILFSSFTGALWMNYFYKKGFSAKLTFWTLGVFWVLPNNILLDLSLWRDIPYYYTYLCMVLLFLNIVELPFSAKRVCMVSFLAISLFLWRVNGIAIAVTSYLVLIFLAWQRKNYKFILYPLMVLFAMIISINQIFTFNETLNPKNSLTLVAMPMSVAYLMDKEDELPQHLQDIGSHLPKSEWEKRALPYANSIVFPSSRYEDDDPTIWREGIDKMLQDLDNEKRISYYISLWVTDFPLQLRTRFNVSPSIWNLRWPIYYKYPGSPTYRYLNTSSDVLFPLYTSNHRKTMTVTGFINEVAVKLGMILLLPLCSLIIIFFFFFDIVHKNLHKYSIIYILWVVHTALIFIVATATDYRYMWISLPTALLVMMLRLIPTKPTTDNPQGVQ